MISSHTLSTVRKLSETIGLITVFIGVVTLCGWMLNIVIFKSVLPDLHSINPMSALCFILAGGALWLLHRSPASRTLSLVTTGGAVATLVVGLVRLLDYTGLWYSDIDRLLFANEQIEHGNSHMTLLTAGHFICVGISLLLFHKETKKNIRPAQIIGLLVTAMSFLLVANYAFTLLSFNALSARFISMPLLTASAFLILGLGLVAAHPNRGMMATLTANHIGSYMLRRLLPVVIGVPFLTGWLRVVGQNSGWFSLETGASLYTVSSICVTAAILWYIAKSLNRIDGERTMAKEAVIASNHRLMQTNNELKAANELKTDLLNIAAHDMKNPLGAIRTMADLVHSCPNDRETTQEMIGLIRDSADHMLHLIEELLRTAALESGTIELLKEYVDMNALVVLVIDGNTLQAGRKSQKIEVQMDPCCTVEGDFSRLREAIDNIVSNAVKYSPADTTIHVSLKHKGGKMLLSVRDEGPGLTADDMKKLFGKFQRLRARPTGNESSTGLGLSIVKQLIELHGGKVWAESAGEGTGSTFCIELPLTECPKLNSEHMWNSEAG